MKPKISKDGTRITTREYEVRELDPYGDAISVNHHPFKKDALANAKALIERGAVAVVVEMHIRRAPAYLFAKPDDYKLILTLGSKPALTEWGGASWEDCY